MCRWLCTADVLRLTFLNGKKIESWMQIICILISNGLQKSVINWIVLRLYWTLQWWKNKVLLVDIKLYIVNWREVEDGPFSGTQVSTIDWKVGSSDHWGFITKQKEDCFNDVIFVCIKFLEWNRLHIQKPSLYRKQRYFEVPAIRTSKFAQWYPSEDWSGHLWVTPSEAAHFSHNDRWINGIDTNLKSGRRNQKSFFIEILDHTRRDFSVIHH